MLALGFTHTHTHSGPLTHADTHSHTPAERDKRKTRSQLFCWPDVLVYESEPVTGFITQKEASKTDLNVEIYILLNDNKITWTFLQCGPQAQQEEIQ